MTLSEEPGSIFEYQATRYRSLYNEHHDGVVEWSNTLARLCIELSQAISDEEYAEINQRIFGALGNVATHYVEMGSAFTLAAAHYESNSQAYHDMAIRDADGKGIIINFYGDVATKVKLKEKGLPLGHVGEEEFYFFANSQEEFGIPHLDTSAWNSIIRSDLRQKDIHFSGAYDPQTHTVDLDVVDRALQKGKRSHRMGKKTKALWTAFIKQRRETLEQEQKRKI